MLRTGALMLAWLLLALTWSGEASDKTVAMRCRRAGGSSSHDVHVPGPGV